MNKPIHAAKQMAAKRMAAEYKLYSFIAENRAKLISLGKINAIRYIQDSLGLDDYCYTKYQLDVALRANDITFMRPKTKDKKAESKEVKVLAKCVLELIRDINSILAMEVGTCLNDEAIEPLVRLAEPKKELETIK